MLFNKTQNIWTRLQTKTRTWTTKSGLTKSKTYVYEKEDTRSLVKKTGNKFTLTPAGHEYAKALGSKYVSKDINPLQYEAYLRKASEAIESDILSEAIDRDGKSQRLGTLGGRITAQTMTSIFNEEGEGENVHGDRRTSYKLLNNLGIDTSDLNSESEDTILDYLGLSGTDITIKDVLNQANWHDGAFFAKGKAFIIEWNYDKGGVFRQVT